MNDPYSGNFAESERWHDSHAEKLYNRAWHHSEELNVDERDALRGYGNSLVERNGNLYRAMGVFDAIQDFHGLRRLAEKYEELDRYDSFDYAKTLQKLEDHEAIRKLLNEHISEQGAVGLDEIFRDFVQPMSERVEHYMHQSGMTDRTGGVNFGLDMVVLRNLAREYDIGVPIARGGLYLGAIADLWELPTRIAGIDARNREIPMGGWVDTVVPEEFEQKRVLLFDIDAVSGVSVRKTLSLIEPFHPAEIGAYFTAPVPKKGNSPGLGSTNTAGLPDNLHVYSPHNANLEHAGDAYIEAHEKLNTLYGQRRKMEQAFADEVDFIRESYPDIADALKIYSKSQWQLFDNLNPQLPGVSTIRKYLLSRANDVLRRSRESATNAFFDLPGSKEGFLDMLSSENSKLPIEYEKDILRGKFYQQSVDIAQNYKIENLHYPNDILASFTAARKAATEGYQIALIVGPEGFAYEPFFREAGLSIVAVNIPESKRGEERTWTELSDLAPLQGKKVLVVEDDVQTGATLQKLLAGIQKYAPAEMGLYLGQPEKYQNTGNIPKEFSRVHAAETPDQTAVDDFHTYLKSRGIKITKDESD